MKTKCSFLLLFCMLLCAVPAVLAQEPQIPDDQKREFLLTAKVTASRRTTKGITSPWRLTLSDGTLTHDAAFQPVDESKARYETLKGIELNFRDSYHFNIAAYELAKLLGLDGMMPVYVERKWGGQTGSLSWWIPDAMDEIQRKEKKLQPPDPEAYNKQMYRKRIFAELVYDVDPNLTNVLITPDWKLWMIDFSRAFRLRTDIQVLKNLDHCDRQLFEKIKSLNVADVRERTKGHLQKGEVDGLMKRRDKIVDYITKLAASKGEAAVFYQ